MIEPVHPFERGVFHRLQMTPRAATMNHLGFVETDDRLGERVIVGIADAAHRGFSTGFSEPFGVANRQILTAADALLCVKP